MWYKLYPLYWDGSIPVKYVHVKDKWDLFAVIGWLYSTSIEKIERIDYEVSAEPSGDVGIIFPPRHRYVRGQNEEQ